MKDALYLTCEDIADLTEKMALRVKPAGQGHIQSVSRGLLQKEIGKSLRSV